MTDILVVCIDRTPDYWKAKGPLRQRALCKAVFKVWNKTTDEIRRKNMFRILLKVTEVEV